MRKNLQTKLMNGLAFIKMNWAKLVMRLRTHKDISSSHTLLPNCSNLLYCDFITVSVTGNTDIVGGNSNWSLILAEYADLIRTPKSSNIFDLWNKISLTEVKLDIVDTMLTILKDLYNVEAANALANLGYDVVEDLDDHDAYMLQLEMIDREAKTLFVVLNQYIAEYKKLAPEGVDLKPRTQMDFEKELQILARYGYKINKRKDTVLEFAAAVNAFIEEKNTVSNGKKAI